MNYLEKSSNALLSVTLSIYVLIYFETGFLYVTALAVLKLFVDQAGLKLRDPSISVFRALGPKARATTPSFPVTLKAEAVIHRATAPVHSSSETACHGADHLANPWLATLANLSFCSKCREMRGQIVATINSHKCIILDF